jgi:hypothetical protein
MGKIGLLPGSGDNGSDRATEDFPVAESRRRIATSRCRPDEPTTAGDLAVSRLSTDEITHPGNGEREQSPLGSVDEPLLDELVASHREV